MAAVWRTPTPTRPPLPEHRATSRPCQRPWASCNHLRLTRAQRGRVGVGGELQGNTVQNLAQLTSKLEHADNKADPGDPPSPPTLSSPAGRGRPSRRWCCWWCVCVWEGGAADVGTGV